MNTEKKLLQLEQKVLRLEKERKLYKSVTVLFLLCVGVFSFSAFQTTQGIHPILKTNQLELVDYKGNVKANLRLGSGTEGVVGVLEIFNHNGKRIAVIDESANGGGKISINDNNEQSLLIGGKGSSSNAGYVALYNGYGEPGAILGINPSDQKGVLSVYDASGNHSGSFYGDR